jgi:hypothetical protein
MNSARAPNVAIPESRIATTGSVHITVTLKYITGNSAGEFFRLLKLMVRGILETYNYNIDKGFFCQLYARTDCDIPDGSYVRGAKLIFKPDSEPVEGAD